MCYARFSRANLEKKIQIGKFQMQDNRGYVTKCLFLVFE